MVGTLLLSLAPLLAKALGNLLTYLEREQLLSAGEAKAQRDNLDKTLELVAKAKKAREAVKDDAESIKADPDRRP